MTFVNDVTTGAVSGAVVGTVIPIAAAVVFHSL